MFRYFSRSSFLCLKSRFLCVSANQSFLLSSPTTHGVQRKVCYSAGNFRLGVSEGLKDKPMNPLNSRYMSLSKSLSSAKERVVSKNGTQPVKLLHGAEDEFGGVIVDMKEPLDSEVFVAALRDSLSKWRKEGKKGVWMKLPIEHANLVEAAVKEGFWYHHAEENYLMLVYWIPNTPNTIPANASHRVGVGACVINDKREMLAVQENSGSFRATGVWKFPIGVVDKGEDICRAAIREVKEGTGIDTKFVEVLAFRQSHQAFFGKSDFFFVCMLRPLSFEIQKQEVEIKAAQWIPIEDYAAQPFVQNHELAKFLAHICIAKIDQGYAGFSPVLTRSQYSQKAVDLYLNSGDMNQPQPSL